MITYLFIAVAVIVSVIGFKNRTLFFKLCFDPYNIANKGEWWRFVSHPFLHGSWTHLFINMFVFYSFGTIVERYFAMVSSYGTWVYLFFILSAGAASSLFSFFKQKENVQYSAVGASGMVAAVLFSSIIFDPLNSLYVFPFPIPIPAVLFGLLYLAYSAYAAKRANDNVGHDAHFWGAIYGVLFTIALKPQLIIHFFSSIFNP